MTIDTFYSYKKVGEFMTKLYELMERTENGDRFQVNVTMELLPFLYKAYANRSRNSVKSMLQRQQVSVNGQVTTQFNDKLKVNDRVYIMNNRTAQGRSQLSGLEILYEDKHLIAVNKAAGLLSISTGKDDEPTAYSELMTYVRHKRRHNRIYIVHRLDRDTSGVMLFAKHKDVQNKLRNHWQHYIKKRQYLALVEGLVQKKSGTITSYLKEGQHYQMYSVSKNQGGKKAVTHYHVRKSTERFSLVDVSLVSGRKNQIRVHMQDIGHPVVGDKKYGSTKNPLKRLGLHAEIIAFVHPITNKFIKITAQPPRRMLRII